MADGIIRGELIAVVDGPALILNVGGQERKYPLGVEVSLAWVGDHMDTPITIKVGGGKVTEIS